MTLKQIEALSKCQFGRYFLVKSYSLELLLYLLEREKAEGIDDLLLELKTSTPKLPAFLSYLSLLESKGCITKTESESKRSKRKLTLTSECEAAVRKHLDLG